MITENEKKILRFLLANFRSDHSINEIAIKCEMAPNGAYTILKKFEKKGILTFKQIANTKSYKINFDNAEANKLLEITLMPNYNESKISYRYNDLKPLEKITNLCIIFGSYIIKEKKPNDIDILFVLEKRNYNKYSEILERVKIGMPFKLHDVIQTKKDLFKNIKNGEVIIKKIISETLLHRRLE